MGISLLRSAILLLAVCVMASGCNPKSPSAPTPVEEEPQRTDLTSVPSDWQYMVNRDTGETMPIKVRLLYLSPRPGSTIVGGVIPMDGCGEGSPYCGWHKFEVCVESDQLIFNVHENDNFVGRKPVPAPGVSILGTPFFSNEEGGQDVSASNGVESGPSANNCYTYDWTLGATKGMFSPFPSVDSAICCKFLNIFVDPGVRRVGEENKAESYTRASASFKVGYKLR